MGLSHCGRSFHVRQRPRRAWWLVVVGAMIAAACMLVSRRWVPLAALTLFSVRARRWTRVAPVHVAMDRVEQGARSIAFVRIRAVRVSGSLVVLESESAELSFDASLVGTPELLVRHLEARVLLARVAGRPKAERVALEALYVFDAEAVRIYKRAAIEILRGDGPWSVAPKERLYVRRRPLDTYRTNARKDVIEVRALEK